MEKTIVEPLSKRKEILYLLSLTGIILLVATLLIAIKKSDKGEIKHLKKYQISAFRDLDVKEQLVFTALYGSGYEIENFHATNGEIWPTISDLESQLISPFVRDRAWKENGQISWSLKVAGSNTVHLVAYFGVPTAQGINGRFLLVLEHYHAIDGSYQKGGDKREPFRIWYSQKSGRTIPTDLSAGYLISNGWKEVIAYKGKDEVKKLGRGK